MFVDSTWKEKFTNCIIFFKGYPHKLIYKNINLGKKKLK